MGTDWADEGLSFSIEISMKIFHRYFQKKQHLLQHSSAHIHKTQRYRHARVHSVANLVVLGVL